MLKRLLLALAFSALMLPTLNTQARQRAPDGFSVQRVAENRISLDQAVAKVQRAIGGRVLDAREVGNDYRIKVLTPDGEVRVVFVDARSGAIR